MLRVALYTRISRDSDKVGKGVARQRKECLELAERVGLTVVAEYEDNDISASRYETRHRPQFRQMLEDAEAGKFDELLAWDLDRLIRLPSDGEKLIALNSGTGLNIRTVSESIDLTTANGRLFLRIKVDVAAHESEHKSDRIKAAWRQRREEGKPVAGRRPFGFAVNGLDLVPEEADLIRDATARLLAGESISSIKRTWNASGLLGDTGKLWANIGIKSVLRRWRNAGVVEHNGEPLDVPSQITPIVSRADLEELRTKLALQPVQPGRKITKSWLSGVMKCGVCGGRMPARKEFYMCETQTERTRVAGDERRHVSIKKSIAEPRVMLALYRESLLRSTEGTEAVDVAEVRKIEAEYLQAQKDRQTATELLLVKGVDRGVITRELARLDAELERLGLLRIEKRTAASEAARLSDLLGSTEKHAYLSGWLEYFESLSIEERRDLARTLDITILKGGKGVKRVHIEGHETMTAI